MFIDLVKAQIAVFLTDGKESCILTSEHQKEVKAIEWRPNSGKMIAVGCKYVVLPPIGNNCR
jgi:hypothetical protein